MEKKEQTYTPRKLKSFEITDKNFIKNIYIYIYIYIEVKLKMIKNEPSSFSYDFVPAYKRKQ